MRRARTGPYRSQNQPQCSATTETTYLLTSSIFSISSSANQSFSHLHTSYRLTRQVRPHILLCWCPLPKTSGQFRFQPIKSSETSCVVGVTFTMIDKAFIEIHLKAWCGLAPQHLSVSSIPCVGFADIMDMDYCQNWDAGVHTLFDVNLFAPLVFVKTSTSATKELIGNSVGTAKRERCAEVFSSHKLSVDLPQKIAPSRARQTNTL